MTSHFELERLSLANLTVGSTPQVDVVRAAHAAGFGLVGLRVMTATADPLQHEVLGRPDVIRELKAALRDTGVRVFDIEAFVLSPHIDLDRFRPALELGAELGATHISSIGTEFAPGATFLTEAQRVDLFGRLCDEAAQYGLTVGVEFMMYRDIRTWREALDMIEAAGRANAGLIVDTLHFFRGGSKPSELSAVPPERFAYAQLSDCPAASLTVAQLPTEARNARLHLGDGVIPLEDILEQLPAQLQLVIETPVAAEASRSTNERALSAAARSARFLGALGVEG